MDELLQEWREEVSALPVEDILWLCYSFRTNKDRLVLYLDVLRGKGGQKAQFASTLICFDLARQGLESFQNEFSALAPTMIELSQNPELVNSMVGDNDYLVFIWDLCQAQLEELQESQENMDDLLQAMPNDSEEVATLNLLDDLNDDDDFLNLDFSQSEETMLKNFQWAVGDFLGWDVDNYKFDEDKGYRIHGKKDILRTEKFVQELDSVRSFIPRANGMRAIGLLFLGSHLSERDFWGRFNQQRIDVLKEAMTLFDTCPEDFFEYVAALTGQFASDQAWPKALGCLMHFVRWHAIHGPDGTAPAPEAAYNPSEKLPSFDI